MSGTVIIGGAHVSTGSLLKKQKEEGGEDIRYSESADLSQIQFFGMWSLEKGGGWDEKWPTSDKQSFRTTKVSIVYCSEKLQIQVSAM